MQKRWMIAGAGVLVVAGAMPWAVGYVTEQQWQAVTQEVNSAQPFVQLQTGEYRRGFLGAELKGSLRIVNPETGEPHKVDYRGYVSHGVTGSLLDFEPAGGWAPEGVDWFPDALPKLTLETRIWGTAIVELVAPVMTITDTETGESLNSSGGLARVEVSDSGSSAEALLVWPAVSLSGPDMDIRISDIHMEQTMAHLLGGLWTGNGELEIGSATVALTDGNALTLRGFGLTSTSEARDGGARLDSRAAIDVQEVARENQSYGPHRLVLSLDNLDVQSWNDVTEGMSELQAIALQQETTGAVQPEQQLAAMEKVNRSVRDLAAAGFSIGFPELILATPEGEVQGNAVIRHPELTGEQKAGMLMVMQRLTGEMNLSLPVALAENYPELRMQLAPMVKQGLLVQDGGRLEMKATMRDLMVDINGVEIPLPPLL